jgi:hypothetical protein
LSAQKVLKNSGRVAGKIGDDRAALLVLADDDAARPAR